MPRIAEHTNQILADLSSEKDEPFNIRFLGWDNLIDVLEFALLDRVKIPKEWIAEASFENSRDLDFLEEGKYNS